MNASENLKRIRLLVSTNATFSLMKCFQYFYRNGGDEFMSDGIMDHLILLLLTVAEKGS